MKRILCLAALVATAGCGGGGSTVSNSPSTPPPAPMDQSVGGIWQTTYTASTGDSIQGLAIATETGQFFSVVKDQTNGCASIQTGNIAVANGTALSGSFLDAIIRFATSSGVNTTCTFQDGSTWANGSLTGTVTQRTSLAITTQGTTANGNALGNQATSWTFNAMYNNDSSLGTIAGNWLTADGSTQSINANGTFFVQDATTGCVVNGTYSIIDSRYNAYAGSGTYASCAGAAAVLNGLTAKGLFTLDTSVVPNQLDGGVSVSLPNGQVVVAVGEMSRE